jgi:hypothetical protein
MLDSSLWGLPSLGAIPDLLDCHRGAVGPSLSSVHAASSDQLSGMTSGESILPHAVPFFVYFPMKISLCSVPCLISDVNVDDAETFRAVRHSNLFV